MTAQKKIIYFLEFTPYVTISLDVNVFVANSIYSGVLECLFLVITF